MILIIFIIILLLFCCLGSNENFDGNIENFKIGDFEPTFEEFCFPKEYKLQKHQLKVGKYFKENKLKSLLVYHRIGAGKTCVSIRIAAEFKNPLFVMPASLIPNFNDELKTPCGRGVNNIKILSYHKFIKGDLPEADVIIIDEFQNVINEKGTFFNSLIDFINERDIPVVIMSATPIFDNFYEFGALLKLLRIDFEFPPQNKKEEDKLRSLLKNRISYFAGAPDYTYPKSNFRTIECPMSKFQTKKYISAINDDFKNKDKEENSFFIKSRQKSNIVAPTEYFEKKKDLQKYSAKFYALMKNLKSCLTFIYSNFTNKYGIQTIAALLDQIGYKNFGKHGQGLKRYCIWSGKQSQSKKKLIKDIFNSRENDDASQIQIVIGSPAIKEGVSLKRVREVHLLETYWNFSRLEQVYGRALRFCSHKDVPKANRIVDIFYYFAINKNAKKIINKKVNFLYSIDEYMLFLCEKKFIENEKYLKILRDAAFDKSWY